MQPGQVRVGKRKTFFQQTPENPGFFIGGGSWVFISVRDRKIGTYRIL
jgi:hypothetical protein